MSTQLRAFRELEQREPGRWALSVGENSLDVLDGEIEIGRGILLELHRALLVPDKDVALEDVLEFRQRRMPELQALRGTIDDFYQKVLASGDGPAAMAAACANIDQACRDAGKVARESTSLFRLASMTALFDATGWVMTGMPLLTQHVKLETTTALLVAAASTAAHVGLKLVSGLKTSRAGKVPYQYVSRYHDELFGSRG